MLNPLVSVIIPCFNSEKYISIAIKSVIEQEYKNVEIIVVDDGSTDNTHNIIKIFNNVRYIYQNNRGPSCARNVGIQVANGEIIAFLDSDDYWEKNKLNILIDFLKTGFDMVFSDYNEIVNNKIIYSDTHKKLYSSLKKAFKKGSLGELLLEGNYILGSTSSVILKKNVLNHVGLFKENIIIGEDWHLWVRIVKAGFKVGFCDKKLTNIVFYPKSLQVRTNRDNYNRNMKLVLESFLKFKDLSNKERSKIYYNLFKKDYLLDDFVSFKNNLIKSLKYDYTLFLNVNVYINIIKMCIKYFIFLLIKNNNKMFL